MQASKANPIYTAFVISRKQNKKYELTNALVSLKLEESKKQIAACATFEIENAKADGVELRDAISVRDRVFIYANDGAKQAEVFRGFVWTIQNKESTSSEVIDIRCYDNFIYFQESEESLYFSSGQNTKNVMSSICNKWGIKLNYSYRTITHEKLVLRGKLAGIFTEDILDKVKDRTGVKYVLISSQDVMQVKTVGSNTEVYTIEAEKNLISTIASTTMDDMITQVKIMGAANKNDYRPVNATLAQNTAEYGTIQKIIDRSSKTALADAKKEAQNILKENSKPFYENNVVTADIPWVRKGDQIKIKSRNLTGTFIVVGVNHSSSRSQKQMELTLELPQ